MQPFSAAAVTGAGDVSGPHSLHFIPQLSRCIWPGGWPQAGRAEDLRQDFRALPLGRRATRYILSYPAYYWANGGIGGASAITLSDGTLGTTGPITTANRVLGGVVNTGFLLSFDYDYHNDQVLVGRPAENLVKLFRATPRTFMYLPLVRH